MWWMVHDWEHSVELDVDLVYYVNKCGRCGSCLPAHIDLIVEDLNLYGISYDCDEQLIRHVMRS